MGQRVNFQHTGIAPLDLDGWWDLDRWPGARVTVSPQFEINAHRIRIDYKGNVRFLHVSDEYVTHMMPDIKDLKILVHTALENWDQTVYPSTYHVDEMDVAVERWEQFFGL